MGVVRTITTEVMVASAQKELLKERLKVCSLLWKEGIKVRRLAARLEGRRRRVFK